MISLSELLAEYLRGPQALRESVDGMNAADFHARPIPGKWSTHEVICHIADFEIINAERIMRILSEDSPQLFDADPDPMAARLHYDARETSQQLLLIECVRQHIAATLRDATEESWRRMGNHSADGVLTVRSVVERSTRHIPHHIPFIREKRAAL